MYVCALKTVDLEKESFEITRSHEVTVLAAERAPQPHAPFQLVLADIEEHRLRRLVCHAAADRILLPHPVAWASLAPSGSPSHDAMQGQAHVPILPKQRRLNRLRHHACVQLSLPTRALLALLTF